MDTRTLTQNKLKVELQKVINAFEQEGRPLEFVGIAPLYLQLLNTSYVVQVYAAWLDEMSNCNDALNLVIDKLYELLSADVLRYINRVNIISDSGEVHCTSKGLILNKPEFETLTEPFDYTA